MPSPKISQAKPTRGAQLFLSCAHNPPSGLWFGDQYRSVAELVEQGGTRAEVEVRIQRWVGSCAALRSTPSEGQDSG